MSTTHNGKKKRYNLWQRFRRALRYHFLKLLRSPDGAKKVALGFAIGFGLEMIVISTASLIYLVFYPIVRLAKGSLPAAIIGNIIGKMTFLPVLLLPLAKMLGHWILPKNVGTGPIHHHSFFDIFQGDFSILSDLLHGGLQIFVGMSIFGLILGIISYYVIEYLYTRRKEFLRRTKR